MPKCPKDPKLNYSIKFCRSKAKNKHRPWCEECKHGKSDEMVQKKRQTE